MNRSLVVSCLTATALSVVIGAIAIPSLAQRSPSPAIVSADRIVELDAGDDGAWALTGSGMVLFCTVENEEQPRVVCLDREGRSDLAY